MINSSCNKCSTVSFLFPCSFLFRHKQACSAQINGTLNLVDSHNKQAASSASCNILAVNGLHPA